MDKHIVVMGMGEIGSVFARAFLRLGYTVSPLLRGMDAEAVAMQVKCAEMVVVAVGENSLQQVLTDLPEQWRDRVVLLQNELLPQDWQQHRLKNPTVISVWFEKKRGMDSKVVMASPVYGAHAECLQQALATLEIPVELLSDEAALQHALVLKNLYILTTNIAGLEVGGNVQQLWQQHHELACRIAGDVLDIQEKLIGEALDRTAMIEGMLGAFDGDPEHACMGRSAPLRLQRALALADEKGLDVPELRRISAAQE